MTNFGSPRSISVNGGGCVFLVENAAEGWHGPEMYLREMREESGLYHGCDDKEQ
jgi:hypothetical protein